MISIVIPHYDKPELTNQLVDSLQKYCSGHELEILVFDNGSKVPYTRDGIWIERVNDNMGFLLAARTGITVVGGKIKILISNDVVISGDFIPPIEEKIKYSPLSLIGNRLIDWDSGWNTFNGKIYPYLEGYFLAAAKEIWDDIAFDPQFAPNDYEDVDLSTQARELGYPLVTLNSPFITHIGAQTIGYGPEREKITRINQEKFRAKWVK
jgi:hypothetical protein